MNKGSYRKEDFNVCNRIIRSPQVTLDERPFVKKYASVEVDHDVQALVGIQTWGPDVEIEAVLLAHHPVLNATRR